MSPGLASKSRGWLRANIISPHPHPHCQQKKDSKKHHLPQKLTPTGIQREPHQHEAAWKMDSGKQSPDPDRWHYSCPSPGSTGHKTHTFLLWSVSARIKQKPWWYQVNKADHNSIARVQKQIVIGTINHKYEPEPTCLPETGWLLAKTDLNRTQKLPTQNPKCPWLNWKITGYKWEKCIFWLHLK